ncbi:MAG: hypothetical protein MJ101_02755 [Clostridia bacterium]|nr:hypothetical protein [Clostridia bacterium]
MFEKMKIKKLLSQKKKLIIELEQKRMRSQAAIMEAILAHESPSDEDTDFFNEYTAKINQLRTDIHELQSQLGISDKK